VADRPRALESLVVRPDPDFWRGKRVLLTGHTGFKGAWLALWLQQLGAEVTGVALAPVGPSNLFEQLGPGLVQHHHVTDICDAGALATRVRAARPDIVLHLAAQALVRESYRTPLQTLATNIMGTAHVLDALRDLPGVRVAVMVTTDKVYRNLEQAYPYRETDALGGHDPYSASKAASEAVIGSYRDAFLRQQGLAVASARAGNVIGGGDWAPDRIIPDAVRAWQQGQALQVRSPEAVRPWQHVLEPLAGYLRLAQCLWDRPELAGAYNFGPASQEAATVRYVIELASKSYGAGKVHYQNSSNNLHEATWLALETAKARTDLGVQPHWRLTVAVDRTLAWYRAQQAGAQARALCLADIAAYCTDLEPTQP
jgi:CDP-glucose 4,6-dehydratase